ncbi:MAG: Mth938-like domain-containing protein [Neomegalonema sp.]|nr:Mth938-like domain-containing protein [Neomegalonema sp.]
MRLDELDFNGSQPPIDGYAPGGFRIAGRFHEGALLLHAKGIVAVDPVQLWDQLDDALLAPLAGEVDILLVGMGSDLKPLPASFTRQLDARMIGVEGMSSPSACRTYNVLLSEGRRVAALLLPV